MSGTAAKSLKQAAAFALVAITTTSCASNGNEFKKCREYTTTVKIEIDGEPKESKLKGMACPDDEDQYIWWASEDLTTLKQLLNWLDLFWMPDCTIAPSNPTKHPSLKCIAEVEPKRGSVSRSPVYTVSA